jgi:hypothetical protein
MLPELPDPSGGLNAYNKIPLITVAVRLDFLSPSSILVLCMEM